MAYAPSLLQSSPPCIGTRPSLFFLSNPPISIPKYAPHLGFAPLSPRVNTHRHVVSIPKFSAKMKRKGKGKKHRGAYASLFGVGAPEVLVIGVVALLVFGPKGLAEAARSLGKTIRAFQPTIKELQEVSREFKSSLEREIGLDEVNSPVSGRNTLNRTPEKNSETGESLQDSTEVGYTADEYLKVTEAQLQRALARRDQTLPADETAQDDNGLQAPSKPTSPKSNA